MCGGGGVGGVSSARGLTGEGAEERNLISAGPGRHREEGPLCPQVTWEPKAESQAVSCGRHWSPSCPRPPPPTPPSPANVGIGLAGLHPASANVSGCEHPPDGRALKWGFVSSLGVWRSDPFSSRRSPGLRPLTTHPLPSPHVYFKLSLAIYSYVRQLRQAESGFRPPGCPWCQHRHPGQSPALLGPRGGPRCASGESALVGVEAPARSPGSARAAAGGRGTPLN